VTAFPLVTEELVRRLERAGGVFMLGWLRGFPGVSLERFGDASAPVCPARPELDFVNRVIDLFPEDADRVEAIVAHYRQHEVRPWFELAPAKGFERLAARLVEAGAAQTGFYSALCGLPSGASDDRIRELGPGEAPAFAEVRMRAYGVEGDREPVAQWATGERFHLYLAELDGKPVATAALVVSDGVGYLADAATLPEFRGRGLHGALIRHRLAAAAEFGCDVVGSVAEFDSTSQHNLERAGLRMAYTKAVWRLRATE
jgi:GNAT superfamily N-acetyltransferase